jgi:hypothetical protein
MRSSTGKLLLLAVLPLATVAGFQGGGTTARATATHTHINCASSPICTEVQDSEAVFGEGKYVGHDEPSTLFYSNRPGSGNANKWQLTLPRDPTPTNPGTPGKAYNFQLHPAFWFGMALCDTQSYPEQLSTCTPNSDTNIVDPAVSSQHPGVAFMEMQFYPPGWVSWPPGNSCDATKWCAALNIDSLSQNPVTGQQLNSTCASTTGVEYVNFAFMTKSGHPPKGAPPNPVNSTLATFTPNHAADLFMNSGDKLSVDEHDTTHGLKITIKDLTTGQTGSMTTSAANGFGQVQYAPTGTTCNNIPYDFHPMYSTSSEKTRVTWAAHSYNVAFSDEIGHWDYCSTVVSFGGNCSATATEGNGANTETADPPTTTNPTGDDTGCFDKSASTLVALSGCLAPAGNTGFDGQPYQPVWPDGNTALHPTSLLFSSPLTNGHNFDRFAFETDLPRIESGSAPNQTCIRFGPGAGQGCTLIPLTDDNQPAVFYPFFSTAKVGGSCVWQLGNHIPGSTNDFGQNNQYGQLLSNTYTTTGGGATSRYNDFRQIFSSNPCPAG